eukprot:3526901-Rhodomonas_salina.1
MKQGQRRKVVRRAMKERRRAVLRSIREDASQGEPEAQPTRHTKLHLSDYSTDKVELQTAKQFTRQTKKNK